MTILPQFSLAAFAAQVGTRFQLADDPTLALELTEATPLDAQAPHDRHFSLILRGPPQPMLAQATHTFTHAQLGELTIFIVPVSRDATGMAYQAIFN